MEDLLQADVQGNLVDKSEDASQECEVGEQGLHVMSVSTLKQCCPSWLRQSRVASWTEVPTC